MTKKYSGKCTICNSNVYVYFDELGSYAGVSGCKHFDGYEEKNGKIFFHFNLKYNQEVEAIVTE